MEHLLSEVRSLFGLGAAPSPDALVTWDGLDSLEKEYAVQFYSGMSWSDVLCHLRSNRSYKLEEWTVLKEGALSYYGRAHLEHLFEAINRDAQHTGFISEFFAALYQLVYMHGKSPFTVVQTSLLERIAKAIPEHAIERNMDSLVDDHVLRNIELYLHELSSRS